MSDFKYEIVEHVVVLSEKGDWTKELNIVSWNGRPGKYDLRDWNHEEGKMRKGITITNEELEKLRDTLNALELNK
ncbi:YdbC family protein [Gottschalkiaceae bacterium SANA]|nr:YdbC family protein [Gottschalkiaceae bacterium SANA]